MGKRRESRNFGGEREKEKIKGRRGKKKERGRKRYFNVDSREEEKMMEETREDALIPFESNFLPWRV